jgi:streptogramin lyase
MAKQVARGCGSLPFGITSGRGQKIWFTELVGNNIGRIAAK